MVIVGLDLETTGFDFYGKKQDRIIEACFSIYTYDPIGHDLVHKKTITQRINPERNIPEDAQAVHGISYEDVKASPKWAAFAPTVQKILAIADVVVIHNAAFDEPFLEGEQQQAGYALGRKIPTFCTMENGRWATFDGKNPSLKELCWSLGVEYDVTKAHSADYDVSVMMECYIKGVTLGLYATPKPREE